MDRKQCKTCSFSSEYEGHFEGVYCTNCYFGRVSQLEQQNAKLRELVEEIKPIITDARILTHTQLMVLPLEHWGKNLSGVAQNLGYLEEKLKELEDSE